VPKPLQGQITHWQSSAEGGLALGAPFPAPVGRDPRAGLLSAPGETSPGAGQGVPGNRLPWKSQSKALIGGCNYNSNQIPQSQPLLSVIEDISHRRVAFFFLKRGCTKPDNRVRRSFAKKKAEMQLFCFKVSRLRSGEVPAPLPHCAALCLPHTSQKSPESGAVLHAPAGAAAPRLCQGLLLRVFTLIPKVLNSP